MQVHDDHAFLASTLLSDSLMSSGSRLDVGFQPQCDDFGDKTAQNSAHQTLQAAVGPNRCTKSSMLQNRQAVNAAAPNATPQHSSQQQLLPAVNNSALQLSNRYTYQGIASKQDWNTGFAAFQEDSKVLSMREPPPCSSPASMLGVSEGRQRRALPTQHQRVNRVNPPNKAQTSSMQTETQTLASLNDVLEPAKQPTSLDELDSIVSVRFYHVPPMPAETCQELDTMLREVLKKPVRPGCTDNATFVAQQAPCAQSTTSVSMAQQQQQLMYRSPGMVSCGGNTALAPGGDLNQYNLQGTNDFRGNAHRSTALDDMNNAQFHMYAGPRTY